MSLRTNTPLHQTYSLQDDVVFFGTGYISQKGLEALDQVMNIEAVITKSDRKKSSGKTNPTPVKTFAQEKNIDCFEADNAEQLKLLFTSHTFRSQVGVVIDYGVIIPEDVINYFPKGIVNSHFSLLPKFRGPDPIRSAIVSGDQQTGVTLIRISPRLDDGDIIAQTPLKITDNDTASTLTSKLITANSELLQSTIPKYLSEGINPSPQDENAATFTKKLTKKDGQLSTFDTARQIQRKVRAYQPWPGVIAKLGGKNVSLINVSISSIKLKPGELKLIDDQLLLGVSGGSIVIKKLKPAGKKDMSGLDFARGYLKS